MNMRKDQIFIGLTRISLGFIFLWAFLDKTFGFGFATLVEKSWISGGSPTSGFLLNATHGPFATLYQSLANNPFIDFIFMIGLLLLGVSLILGIGVKIAGYSGALLMILMYTASMPPENNPILDEHIIYALILVCFANMKNVGYWIGIGKLWSNTKLVKKLRFLE